MTNVGFIFRTLYEKSGESWTIVACMLSTNPLLLFALGWSRTTRSQTLLAPRGSRREYTLPHSTMGNSAIGAIFVWPPCKMPSQLIHQEGDLTSRILQGISAYFSCEVFDRWVYVYLLIVSSVGTGSVAVTCQPGRQQIKRARQPSAYWRSDNFVNSSAINEPQENVSLKVVVEILVNNFYSNTFEFLVNRSECCWLLLKQATYVCKDSTFARSSGPVVQLTPFGKI